MNERINFIDYTKGYGILLVVMSHIMPYFDILKFWYHYIEGYHMTLFFIIAGVLNSYRNKDGESWKKFVLKRYKSLIIPYIYFSLFNTTLKFAVLLVEHNMTKEVFNSEMVELLIKGNGTVWFLVTLFLTELMYRFVSKFKSKMLSVLLALVCLILCFLVKNTPYPLVVVILRVMAAYSFYVSGILLGKYVLQKYSINSYFGTLLVFLGLFSFYKLGSNYSFFYANFQNPLGSILTIYLSSFGFIFIFKNINRDFKIWSYIGRNSLIIMLVHPIVLLFYSYPAKGTFLLLPYITQWMILISVFVTIIVVNVIAIQIINKKIPFIIGK